MDTVTHNVPPNAARRVTNIYQDIFQKKKKYYEPHSFYYINHDLKKVEFK